MKCDVVGNGRGVNGMFEIEREEGLCDRFEELGCGRVGR